MSQFLKNLRNDRIPLGALIRRELLETLRRKRIFFLLLAMMAGMEFFLATCFLDFSRYALMSPAQMTSTSQFLLASFIGVYLAIACFFIPLFAANRIVIEKQQDTFDQLHTTLIRPWAVVCGKLIGVLGIFLLLGIAGLPLIGVVFFLLGIDWGQFLISTFLLLGVACCSGAAGLYCSARMRHPFAAMACGVFLANLMLWGGFVPRHIAWKYAFSQNVFASSRLGFPQESFTLKLLELANAFTPGGAVLQATTGDLSFLASVLTLLVQGLFTIVFLRAAVHILRLPPKYIAAPRIPIIDDARILEARRTQFPYYLIDPCRRRKPIPDWLNPFIAKEALHCWFDHAEQRIRLLWVYLIGCCMLSLPAYYPDLVRNQQSYLVTVLTIEMLPLLLAIPPFVSHAMASEHERDTFDLLRTTLLRPRHFVRGKIVATYLTFGPFIFAAALPLGLPFPFLSAHLRAAIGPAMFLGLATMTITCMLAIVFSIIPSVLFLRTNTALAGAYLVTIGLLLALPLVKLPFTLVVPNVLIRLMPGELLERQQLFVTLPSPPFALWMDLLQWSKDRSLLNAQMAFNLLSSLMLSLCLMMMPMRLFRKFRLRDR